VLADVVAKAKNPDRVGAIAPLAVAAGQRIDALFDIERGINRLSPEDRLAVRAECSAPLVAGLETWMRAERARLSRHAPVAHCLAGTAVGS
jgi:transposase